VMLMLTDPQVSYDVQRELESDESLLWAGKPQPTRMMIPALPASGLGIVWTSFTVNFIVGWYSFGHRDVSGPSGLFGMHGILSSLFFVPFILIGVGMLLSPLWCYVIARNTVYAVTDKRALIIQRKWPHRVETYGQSDMINVVRTERRDGSGDLTFAKKPGRDSEGHSRMGDVKFVGIPEVRTVERLLRDLSANREREEDAR